MVDGLNGPFSRAVLFVDQDDKIEHELATTHPPRAAELTAWDLPWKREIVTMDLA